MNNRVSNKQLEALLDFLAEHPALASGVGLGARSKEAVDKQWNDIAKKLNAYGSGSKKSGERWKKYWADLKHKSKTRVSKWKQNAFSTGGGPGRQDDLTELDKKILSIVGEETVFCDTSSKPENQRKVAESIQVPSEITPEWVKDLEQKRVEAETKVANATMIIAESTRLQAETARSQTEILRILLELVRRQSDEMKTLAEITRTKQDEQ